MPTNEERREVAQGLADMLDPRTEPDSWEKLEADAGKTSCAYFGREGTFLCSSCDHDAGCCLDDQRRDMVLRAKKLAEVEE